MSTLVVVALLAALYLFLCGAMWVVLEALDVMDELMVAGTVLWPVTVPILLGVAITHRLGEWARTRLERQTGIPRAKVKRQP